MAATTLQITRTSKRTWPSRILFLALAGLLGGIFLLGMDPYYKLLVIQSTGLTPTVNMEGRMELYPAEGLPAAVSGLYQGDTLLAVNGQTIDAKAPTLEIIHNLKFNRASGITLDVQRADGSLHRAYIPLDAPIPALFGLSTAGMATFHLWLDLLLVLGYSIPAFIITWRKPGDRFALFVAMTLLLTGFRSTSTILYAPNVAATLVVFGLFAASRILLLVFLFVFPNGEYVPAWTKRFVIPGGLWAFVSIFIPAFYELSGQTLDLTIFAVGLWAQIHRQRHISNLQEQQQTKWIVSGIVVAFVVGYLSLLAGFIPAVQATAQASLRYAFLERSVTTLALLAIPVTVLISIFRYRLYEIDVIINRALVYAALTAILSGLYVALTGFFSRFFIAFTGQKSEAVTVLATLIVVTSTTPLKNHLQTMVDRRFKETPDASRRLRDFIEQLHTRLFAVNPEEVMRRLLEESVRALGSEGGAVQRDNGTQVIATRTWDGREYIKARIRSDGKEYGTVSLGKRANGAEYTQLDHRLMQETANRVALVLEQDHIH